MLLSALTIYKGKESKRKFSIKVGNGTVCNIKTSQIYFLSSTAGHKSNTQNISKKMNSLATRYIKQCSCSTTVAVLHHPSVLNIPTVLNIHTVDKYLTKAKLSYHASVTLTLDLLIISRYLVGCTFCTAHRITDEAST